MPTARVCIVGASYGGYAALAGAAFTPDLYQCAVSIAGVSHLPKMLKADKSRYGKKLGARGALGRARYFKSRRKNRPGFILQPLVRYG